jgi:hypothetical protein
MQAPQLQHDEEQEEDDRTARDEQVLPVLPEAYVSQREQMKLQSADFRFQMLDFKSQSEI